MSVISMDQIGTVATFHNLLVLWHGDGGTVRTALTPMLVLKKNSHHGHFSTVIVSHIQWGFGARL